MKIKIKTKGGDDPLIEMRAKDQFVARYWSQDDREHTISRTKEVLKPNLAHVIKNEVKT